jgi:hypothetical protein
LANGSISIAVSGGAGPFTWTWTAHRQEVVDLISPIVINGLMVELYTINILSPSTDVQSRLVYC